jgi:hypothetical protein
MDRLVQFRGATEVNAVGAALNLARKMAGPPNVRRGQRGLYARIAAAACLTLALRLPWGGRS